MGEINLKQVAQRYLVHETNSAEFILNRRYLIEEPFDRRFVTKLKFLEYLDKHLNLGYGFNASNLKYWHLSPVLLVDPLDKKKARIRISALNGNGKYTGYRDFTYNRIDLADYCRVLELHSMSDSYDAGDLDITFFNLLGHELADGEVELTVTELDGVKTYSVEVIDVNSLLWYGKGQIRVTDLPDISRIISVTTLVLKD